MRRAYWLPVISLALACATVPRRVAAPRQESEGELYVQLRPFPRDAARLTLELSGVWAVREDGALQPLQILQGTIPGPFLRPGFIASGRLERGSYVGLAVGFKRATLGSEGRASDLLLPEGPVRAEVPFAVAPRQATVIALSLGAAPAASGFSFAPALSAAVSARTVPELAGLCSNRAGQDVAVFDKVRREVTAILPTGAEPWGVAIDPTRNRAYVAASGEDEIDAFDLSSSEEVARIRLENGDGPREIAVSPDGRWLLAANAGSNTVSFVDLDSLAEVERIPAGQEPSSLLLERGGRRAYVFSGRTASVSVVDLATRAVAASFATDDVPLRGQFDRAGTRLYLAHAGSPQMEVVSLADFTVSSRVYVGLGSTAVKVDPATDLIYVANRAEGRIAVYDPIVLAPVDSIPVPGAVAWLAIDDAQNALLALIPERRSIAVFDLTTRAPIGEVEVGAGAAVLALMGERE